MFVLASFFALFLGHFIAPFISLCDTFIFKAPRDLALIWKKEARKKIPICLVGLVFHSMFFTPKMLAHDLMGANFHFFRRLLSGSLEVGLHVENC